MKTFILVLLGLVGAAGAGYGAWQYLTDGGMSRMLYEQDAQLMTLDQEQREDVLAVWGEAIEASAPADAAPAVPGPVAPRGAGGDPGASVGDTATPAPVIPTASATYTRLAGLADKARETFDEGKASWRASNSKDTAGLRKGLGDIKTFYTEALATREQLGTEERAVIDERAVEFKKGVINEFLTGHGAFAAVNDGEVKKLITDLRGLADRLARN